jgi:hypothetical protein
MMATYREDMAKVLEVMARRKGLPTSYAESGRAKCSEQHNSSRKKRMTCETDDPDGPPDTKRKFQSGTEYMPA